MSVDISKLLQRLTLIENTDSAKSNLDAGQKTSDQVPALFKPKKSTATDPAHPMQGKLVGESSLEEAINNVEETMLEKVRKDLNSYLDTLKDTNKLDKDLVDKAKHDLDTNEGSFNDDGSYNTSDDEAIEFDDAESDMEDEQDDPIVTTIAMEGGKSCAIYGNSENGFEIGQNGRRMKSKFKTLEQATFAIEMYKKRCASESNDNNDYLEEA